MNEKRIRVIIKISGIIISLRACQVLVVMVASFGTENNGLVQLFSQSPEIAILKVLILIIIACVAVAGYGLFSQKKWSRKFAIEVLAADWWFA